jgi:hypothetical protein
MRFDARSCGRLTTGNGGDFRLVQSTARIGRFATCYSVPSRAWDTEAAGAPRTMNAGVAHGPAVICRSGGALAARRGAAPPMAIAWLVTKGASSRIMK